MQGTANVVNQIEQRVLYIHSIQNKYLMRCLFRVILLVFD